MIEYARETTSSEAFGQDSERAIALRVLHIYATEEQQGGNPGTGTGSGSGHAGNISSETEGQLSRSFSTSQQFASQRYGALSTTSYGQELIELIRSNIMAPMTRRNDEATQNLLGI
jgi:hypothetical protein